VAISEQFSRAKILIVDDKPTNLVLLQKILEVEGYTEITAIMDSREVEETYRQNRFDLVLLDLSMPYLDGFQVMAQLTQIDPDGYLPILVLTAQGDPQTRLRSLNSGAKDFIAKPFDRVEVLTRIHNMLEVRLLHNQLRDQNIILEDKVRERTQELHDTRLEIIRRLGRAAEYRDNETGLHIIRMSKFSECLGRATGMTAVEADMLLNASPMHDIGKIGIPDKILLKPGKFEADEWEIMKSHAAIGAEILAGQPSPLMDMARSIALTHHEKWDGSGYPNNLKGESIPLVGRITALCDVFDALMSDRPYKKAWTVEAAVGYINENSGLHFEPALVKAFGGVLPELLAIREKFSEPVAP